MYYVNFVCCVFCRALFIMSKSGFRPPALKDKKKWTENFQNFVKLSLTKQPKRRPTADKLLEVSDHFIIPQVDMIWYELTVKVCSRSMFIWWWISEVLGGYYLRHVHRLSLIHFVCNWIAPPGPVEGSNSNAGKMDQTWSTINLIASLFVIWNSELCAL